MSSANPPTRLHPPIQEGDLLWWGQGLPIKVMEKPIPKLPTEDTANEQVVHCFCRLATQRTVIRVREPVATLML
jgi:hypothetical protein